MKMAELSHLRNKILRVKTLEELNEIIKYPSTSIDILHNTISAVMDQLIREEQQHEKV